MYCQYCHAALDPELNELYGGFCSAAHRELHTEVLRRRDSLSLESPRPTPTGANKTEDFSDGCPICGTTIPLLAKLRGARFCSSEHEEQYQRRGEAQILERLNWHAQGGAGSGPMISGRKPKLRRPPSRQMAVELSAPRIPMPERPVQWTASAPGVPAFAPAQRLHPPDAAIGFGRRLTSPQPPPAWHCQFAAPPLHSVEQSEWTEPAAALTPPPSSPPVGSCAPRPRRQTPARSAALPAPQTKRECAWVQPAEAQPTLLPGPEYKLQPALPARRLSQKSPQPHRHEAGLSRKGVAATPQAWALAPSAAPALALLPPPRLGSGVLPLRAKSDCRLVRPAWTPLPEGSRGARMAEWNESAAVVPHSGAAGLPCGGPALEVPRRGVSRSRCEWVPARYTPVPRQTNWMGDAWPKALPGAPKPQAAGGWPNQLSNLAVAVSHFARPVQEPPVHLSQVAWTLCAAGLLPAPRPSVVSESAPSTLARKRDLEPWLLGAAILPEASHRRLQWIGGSGTETAPACGPPLVGISLAPHPPHHGLATLRLDAFLPATFANATPQAWSAGSAAISLHAGLPARPLSAAAGHLQRHRASTTPFCPGPLIPARPAPKWSAVLQPAPADQMAPWHPNGTGPQLPPHRGSARCACQPQCLESGLDRTLPATEWPAASATAPTAGSPGVPPLAAYTIGRRTAPAGAPPGSPPSLPKATAADGTACAFATPAIGSRALTAPSAKPPSWTAIVSVSRSAAMRPVAPGPLAAAPVSPAWIDSSGSGVFQTLLLAPAWLPQDSAPAVGSTRRQFYTSLRASRLPARTTRRSACYLAPQRPCHPPCVTPVTAFSQTTFRRYPANSGSAFGPLALEMVRLPRPEFLVTTDLDPASTILATPPLTLAMVAPGLSHRPPASLGRLVASGTWSRRPPYPVRLRTPSMQILLDPAPKHPNQLKRAPD
jgi:hypothetical protein